MSSFSTYGSESCCSDMVDSSTDGCLLLSEGIFIQSCLTSSVCPSVCLSNRKRVKSTLPQKCQPAAPQVGVPGKGLCYSHYFTDRGVFFFTRPAQEVVGKSKHHEWQQISSHWQVYPLTQCVCHTKIYGFSGRSRGKTPTAPPPIRLTY